MPPRPQNQNNSTDQSLPQTAFAIPPNSGPPPPPQLQSPPRVDAIAQVGQPAPYQAYGSAIAQPQSVLAQQQQFYGATPVNPLASSYAVPQPGGNVAWPPSAQPNLPARQKLKATTIALIVGTAVTIFISLAVIVFVVLGQLGNSHLATQSPSGNSSSYGVTPTSAPTATPIPPLATYPVPPEIQQVTDRLGITDQVKTIQFVESSNIATDCQSDFAFACADIANDRIFYSAINLKSVDSLYQNTSIAHEYLHIFWYRLENPNYAQTVQLNITKDQIKEKLKAIYELHYPALDKRLSDYFNSGLMQVGNESFYTELHSFVGTEMNDSELPPDLLQYFSQILPVRTQFSKYY